MGHSASRTLQYDVTEEVLFKALLSAFPTLGVARLEIDNNNKTLQAETGASLRSWGERIHISVHANSPGKATATLTSSLKLGLIDWGKNNSNLDFVENAVSQSVFEKGRRVCVTLRPG